MKYTFYQDVLCRIWQRQEFEIEAESEEEAIEAAKAMAHQDVSDTDKYVGSEFLYDTEETVKTEENYGNPTIEIYSEKDLIHRIADNNDTPIIGYQVTTKEGDFIYGTFSFQVFRTKERAIDYAKDLYNDVNKLVFTPIYDGQIENPSFI